MRPALFVVASYAWGSALFALPLTYLVLNLALVLHGSFAGAAPILAR